MIVAEPGRLREGLQAMLASFLGAEPMVAGGAELPVMETIRSTRPDLIILDSGFFDARTEAFVRELKSEWNWMGCVLLIDRIRDFQTMQDAGADCVLLKGFPAGRLFAAVEELLPQDSGTGR